MQLLGFLSRKAEDERVYHSRPLIFAFGMCAGVATYFSLTNEPRIFLIAGFWVIVFGVLQITLRKSGSLGILLALIGFSIASGIAVAKVRTLMVHHGSLENELGPIMVEGWVTAIEPATKGVRVRMLTHAVEGVASDDRPLEIRLTHRAALQVSPGRFVRCLAVLRRPPDPSIPGDYDFRRQAWFEGLHAVGYVQGRCRGGALGQSNDTWVARTAVIAAYRRNLAEYTRVAAGPRAGGFAAALTSGDRSFMRLEDREALREAGLAHLLAISGLHIGIVCGLVYLIVFKGLARISWLARRMPLQKPAAVTALTIGAAYLVISGASVSTQRAFIMAALVFIAILIDRNAISLRTFAIAMVVIVVISPGSVLTPGFQMSFAATGVLIAIYEVWRERRLKTPQGFGSNQAFAVKSLFVTSVAAGLATAPFAFYHFDRIAPFGLIANLLAMPIISFVTAPAAAASMLLAPFGLAEYGLRVFGWSLEWVLAISHWASGTADAANPQWKPMPEISLFLFSCSVGAFILLTDRLRTYAAIGFGSAALGFWLLSVPASAYWAPSGDVYARIDGQYQRIAFLEGEGLSPLRYKDLPVSGYCQNRRCLIETDNGKLLLIANEGRVDCGGLEPEILVLSGSPANQSCPDHLSFLTIKERGGAAIWLSRAAPKIRFASSCGQRPWMSKCKS